MKPTFGTVTRAKIRAAWGVLGVVGLLADASGAVSPGSRGESGGGGAWSDAHSGGLRQVLSASRVPESEPLGGLVAEVFERVVSSALSAGGPVFQADLGEIPLLPNQADQWVTLSVRNVTAAPVQVSGMNFFLQVADTGPASERGRGLVDGPNIQSVDLSVGTLFAGNNTGTAGDVDFATRSAQAGGWYVTTTVGTTVTIPAGASVPMARVNFDTRGFSTPGAQFPLSLTFQYPGDAAFSTELLQESGGQVITDTVGSLNGTLLIAVPEARGMAIAAGLGLLGFVLVRGRRRW